MLAREYDISDSGTDDDIPSPHQNRNQRGRHVVGNGRPAGSAPYSRFHNDMETQIYHLEQEAYRSVLLAFKAQSDTTITWEKTSLMAELRKELNISEDEHKASLGKVDADDNLRRIREWRQSGGLQPGLQSTSQPVSDSIPSPTFSASRKRQKTSQLVPSHTLPRQTSFPSIQPSLSAANRGSLSVPRSKKPISQPLVNAPSKSTQYASTISSGRGQVTNRVSSGALAESGTADLAAYDPSLIGRKVRIRWPDDNSFYESVITDYKDGLYALVYDMNTPKQSWEWVNLAEIPPEDILWEGEDHEFSRHGRQVGLDNGIKNPVVHSNGLPGMVRGRVSSNGISKKASRDIEILRTDTLIKEVEKIFEASHPDPLEIQKAKKVLKEHEQDLVDAIAKLANAYDAKTDEGERPRHGQPANSELSRKKHGDKHTGESKDAREARRVHSVLEQDDDDDDDDEYI